MRTCVLILNWNGRDLTLGCVRSLLDAGVAPPDVLVVDNGSTDGSADALAKEAPTVRQLALGENRGFTGGCNAGIDALLAEGRHDAVLLLNNDTLATPGLVKRLEDALARDPRVAIAQPKIAYFDRATIENAGFEMDRYGVTWPRARGAGVTTPLPDAGYFYASGACALVRLDALREVGAFDDAYFCYHEDVDLSWRMRLAGWRLAYVDDALCYHGESMTAGRADTKIGVIWRNRFRTLLKNYAWPRALVRLPAALALTLLVALGSAFLQRRPVFVALYAKAVAWNLARLASTLRERRRVQRLRRVPDREIEAAMCASVELRMMRARRSRT